MLVVVIFVGTLMLIGAVGQLIQAWRVKNWGGFFVWSLSGLLYAAAGVVAIVNPFAGAALLTLLLGATLIGAGAFRLWVWFNNRGQKRSGEHTSQLQSLMRISYAVFCLKKKKH